ncbi:MAG: InlB B-repeat-containing protein, partial [Kiritimatiellae bacterium]|nr:InlB B-repeat-containing protein [Kiritimatiellia bacterium]
NCHVDDTCSLALGVNQHAGIAGNGTATGTGATISFTHCTMAAALSTEMSSGSQFGGIAGNLMVKGGGRTAEYYAHLIMDGCTNYSGTGSSTWTGSNRSFGGLVHTAGIGASTQMGDAVIRRCANYGSFLYNATLTSSGTNYGGLVGRWSSGKLTMEDCVNYGSVASTGSGDARSEIGGLIGAIVAPIQVEVSITGCANAGDITGWYAGGLVGTLSHNKDYVNTKILIRSCMNTGAIAARKEGVSPGEAIGALISGVAYSRIDIEGGFYATDALVGTYGEGASVTALNTDGNVFSDNSDGLVDGADLAALNAYNSGCNLWKQGHEFPILKIMPDEAAPDTIVATFEDWDETILKQKTIALGGYAIPPADPVRDGYTFIGWIPATFTGLTADTTFTAQYSSGILTHTVTFYDWDGSQIGEAQTIAHGEAATAPADPVREDYLFAGWSVPFDNVTEDLQVFAQYVASHTYVLTAEGFAAAVTADVLPGVTIHLSADIVLPADWAAPDFRAVFDGGGHTISCENGGLPLFGHLSGTASNFVINAESDGAPLEITIANNVSFGAVARIVNGGTVADVSVLNLTVKLGGGSKAGLLVGELGDGGMILGCTAEGTCTLRHKQGAAGGIVGGVFRSSDFAPVDGEGNPVLGLSVAVIADCTNNAPLVQTGTSGFQAGGILGSADVHNPTYQPDIRILRCANHGDLRAVAGYAASGSVGGILGQRSVNASGHGGVL